MSAREAVTKNFSATWADTAWTIPSSTETGLCGFDALQHDAIR